MKTHEFRISQVMFDELSAHLFPGDHDEHGAVIAAGICRSKRGTRFLARKLFLAREGIDYVPSKYGYRALSAEFVARVSGYCSQHKLAYFAIHCHGGRDEVAFSSVDLESHKRSYPHSLILPREFRSEHWYLRPMQSLEKSGRQTESSG